MVLSSLISFYEILSNNLRDKIGKREGDRLHSPAYVSSDVQLELFTNRVLLFC